MSIFQEVKFAFGVNPIKEQLQYQNMNTSIILLIINFQSLSIEPFVLSDKI